MQQRPQKFTLAAAITRSVSFKFANFRIGRANPFLALHKLSSSMFFLDLVELGVVPAPL
jgi:hypothetical protein